MFNRWKEFPKYKPNKDGWYITTIEIKNQQRYTMELYYDLITEKFIDNKTIFILDMYDVRSSSGTKITYKDLDCDRTNDVVAWKKISKPYMKNFKKINLLKGSVL